MTQVNSGNLPIPNDTGANVLADINENLNALQNNNAGNTEPPVAKAHQTYIDTSGSVDVLKIRGNADNASFITLGNLETNLGMMPKTGGSFTGEITTVAGTKVSPAIKLDDANTGLYEPATDTIGITCGGNDVAYVDSAGIEIKDGKKLEFRDSGNSNVVSLQAPALTSDVALTLPNSNGNAGDKLESDGNGNLSWQPVQGVPSGTIFPFAGSESNLPSGYLECDGSEKSSTTYATLSTLLGSTYNNGQTPASGNFFLPDLRGRFPRGWDHGAGLDSGRTRGSTQTNENKQHTHSSSGTATVTGGNHSHTIRRLALNQNFNSGQHITLGSGQSYYMGFNNSVDAGGTIIGNSGNLTLSGSISLTINNQGTTESRPENIALIYIIKT